MVKMGILGRVVTGYQEAGIVLTACRLGIFEELEGGASDAARLAAAFRLEAGALAILLDALVALGLLRKKGGRYRLSDLSSRYLVPDRAGYLGDLYRHQERMWRQWRSLETALRGRRRGWEDRGGEAVREFVLAMEANAGRLGRQAAGAVDLAGVRRLLDLGGGPGTYARFFLERKPSMKVTVFDKPGIVKTARNLERNRAYRGALSFRGGDFLRDPLGRDYDLVWASNVLHSLGPRDAAALLGRCFAALAGGGRLLLHDFFLNGSGTGPRRAAVFSVHMLAVTPAGRSWRLKEARTMMAAAGFRGTEVVAGFRSTAILGGRRP